MWLTSICIVLHLQVLPQKPIHEAKCASSDCCTEDMRAAELRDQEHRIGHVEIPEQSAREEAEEPDPGPEP